MRWKTYLSILIVFSIGANSFLPFYAYAQTPSADDLKNKIEERNNQIKQIEEEIRQYNIEVANAGSEAKTLQGTIKSLELTKKKLLKDISLTESKISKANLTIEQLDDQIVDTKSKISINKKAIISAIKSMQSLEDLNLTNLILSNKNVSDIWIDIDNIGQVQETIRNKSKELSELKVDMESKQVAIGKQKDNLVGLKQDLGGKKVAVEYTAKEKSQILAETKNKEQAFKQLVATKEQLKEQFEKEVFDFESQLNLLIDKGSYPKPKNGILSWPLDDVYITQKFGKTVGAEKLYTSGSHNGVDFRASIGTKVKNVLSGEVVGTGNTDAYSGCYSFGKWVMVKHDNGLSTIYGHLSVISAQKGQRLETGDTVGFSGNTGYSTGPHLHISVYATQGVRIEQFVNSRGCKQAVLPLADVKAYLDPLAYFPKS